MIHRATLPLVMAITPLETGRHSFELLERASNGNQCMRRAF